MHILQKALDRSFQVITILNGMKRMFLIILIFGVLPIFGQQGTNRWFNLETSVTGDFINNLSGGIKKGYTYIGMEELGIAISSSELGWWENGELFLHGLNSHGITPSTELVGDLQVSSNIESGNYTGLYEYYYRQNIGNFSILVGQHDLNSEFAGTEYGGTFVNSSFGISPSISLNVPVSIYPMASPALVFIYEQENKMAYRLGVYDGNPGDPESNRYNLQPNINLDDGFLFIGEYELYHLVNSLTEACKIGAYYHTNQFVDYNDTLQNIRGNYGLYTVCDMVLWSGFNHPDSYLGAFLQTGWAPASINQVEFYIGGGFHLNGLLPQRYQDAMGIAFAWAEISKPFKKLERNIRNREIACELTYKIHVFKHYSIQPNVQYIINPGASTTLSNALVTTIRFNIRLEN